MTTRFTAIIFATILLGIGVAVHGQSAILLGETKAVRFFPGANRLTLTWTNPSPEQVSLELIGELFQETSALALPLGNQIRQKLSLFPNQAALTTTAISAPDVRAKSAFVIRWRNATGKILGKTEFDVYPRTLLHELETIAGTKPLGLMSPDPGFRKGFEKASLHFQELYEEEVPHFDGHLLIVGARDRDSWLKALAPLAKRGVTVIFVSLENDFNEPLRPDFFGIPYAPGGLVCVQGLFLRNFEADPKSQLRLVEICRMAAQPGSPDLPMLNMKGSL